MIARTFREVQAQAESQRADLAGQKERLEAQLVELKRAIGRLAPDIIEAILDGQEPDGLSLWGLRRDVPVLWSEQREEVGLDTAVQDADDDL